MGGSEPVIHLRAAQPADADRILHWRNEETAVRFSSSGRAVTPDEHREWFARRLRARPLLFWIAEIGGEPVGQVRIDASSPGTGVVSLAVDPSRRGAGIGSAILVSLLAGTTFADGPTTLVAVIDADNRASVGAFERAGFHPAGVEPGGHRRFEWP